ncbi:cell envelope integrity protein TolA [Frischella perrara]
MIFNIINATIHKLVWLFLIILMAKKIKSNFSLALIISIILHLGLISMLAYSAWHYSSSYNINDNGQQIEAIMVDSNILNKQKQRLKEHEIASQQIKQQQQQIIEKQAQELQEKQLAEQQRLKQLAKESLLASEKQKQEQEAIAKALAEKQKLESEAIKAKEQLEEQKKQALIAKQKAEEEAKLAAQNAKAEKERIEAEKKQAELDKQAALLEAEKVKKEIEKQKQLLEQEQLKAEQVKQEKLKAEQLAKQKAAEEKQRQKDLNDILGGLTSKAPSSDVNASSADLNQFKSMVMSAISNKFINPKLYQGKNCNLKIQLAPDGLLLNVSAGEGDPALCREAISATRSAIFPKPKNNQLYKEVKNLDINFSPK